MTNTKKPAFTLLFLLISFASVSAALFTPALPAINSFFNVSASTAALTMTLFLVGYALGQLIYGPLANRYGRKPALYFGISLAILASFVCALSANLHSFWLLVAARFVMALGASVGLKMTFTLISETHAQESATKIIAQLMIACAITPGLGVALGGYLTSHFNWQSCFYFLAGYGIILLLLSFGAPETAKQLDLDALKPSKIVKKYRVEFSNKGLVLSSLILGCATSTVYLFGAVAPFIAMSSMHLNPSQYGLWNLLPPLGVISGSQLCALAAKKLNNFQAIFLGVGITLLSALFMLITALANLLDPIFLFLPLTLMYVGISFIFSNGSALAMQHAHDKPSGSAIMNFINMGTATVCVLSLGFFSNLSFVFLAKFYVLLLIFACIFSIILNWNFSAKS